MRSIIYALAAAVCTALTVSKGDTSENPVRLTFVNVCKAPVEVRCIPPSHSAYPRTRTPAHPFSTTHARPQIFWLAHDGKGQATEEVHKGSIPMNEARDLATSVGQTWRIKWADHQIYEENHFGALRCHDRARGDRSLLTAACSPLSSVARSHPPAPPLTGKHVLEEHVIESDPGMNQEIRICWRARQRAAQQDL
jgi:hypothetical protein